ncbi:MULTISPECIES: hypothetical protein [Nostocales]|uniref:Uncharacterized protein n=1 Tax=Dolichospermum flos-aquae UHCC 0037 TaxID=2590026 RepID=A0ACC7S7F5_DOLFA|nr:MULTISPECIES: hypothetical protein [Nostocales]MBO1066248.1 hypothetical protein [Anabaena sp. 54]MTJ43744.1 hypothetical protein [Dolichospermum flos-aquae UHCC 0037]
MASKEQLIKEVAQEIKWTQADVKRALDEYGDVHTKEDILACCLRFAGPELKKRNYQIGSLKKVSKNDQEIIKQLTEQLINTQNFFQNQMVPTLKATITAQAERIEELLKQMPWAS